MMQRVLRAALLIALALLPAGAGLAREGKPPKPGETKAAEAPVSAEPSETSASFGDWVVRCQRVGQESAATRVCEAAQSLLVKGQQAPIAQIAFGRAGAAATMVTVLLPTNVSFDKPPSLALQGKNAEAKNAEAKNAETKDASVVTLAWRRCLPGGCLADVKLDTGFVRALRSAAQGRLAFTDAAERTIALPLSFRGLPQALDDLEKQR